METKISEKLLELREIEVLVKNNQEKIDKLREEILTDLRKNELKQYKDDTATVTFVTRKSFKITPEVQQSLIAKLPTEYLVLIPVLESFLKHA